MNFQTVIFTLILLLRWKFKFVQSEEIIQPTWEGLSIFSLPTILPLPTILRAKSPIVNITNGQIQGIIATSRDGRKYFEFLGIPYAKPPINKLRFMPPEHNNEKWSDLKEFHTLVPMCPQSNPLIKSIDGDENCLKLNVYQPNMENSNSKSLLPVMVWFHGGAFISGSSHVYGAKYFMDQDVILVVVQYRLGALEFNPHMICLLGFLSTGDSVIRGNMGFMDQIMSLKWVRDNIKNFNGNPNKVTIFGESAGGASVHYLVISPLAKGLFHKAIAQSGTAVVWWALNKDPANLTKRFAKKFNCSTTDSEAILKCLRKVDFKLLVQYDDGFSYTSLPPRYDRFVGTIDGDFIEEDDQFLPKHPKEMIKAGNVNKVSLILSITAGEGGLISSSVESSPEFKESLKSNWHEYSCLLCGYPCTNATKDTSNKLLNHYFGLTPNKDPSQNLQNLTQMISEILFWYPAHKAAIAHSQVAPTRLVFYNYSATISLYPFYRGATGPNAIPQSVDIGLSLIEGFFNKLLFSILDSVKIRLSSKEYKKWGPTHGDDILMLFALYGFELTSPSSSDYTFSKMFVKGWVDFTETNENSKLKIGNVTWPKIDTKDEFPEYLILDSQPKVEVEPFKDSVKFWDNIFEEI